MLLVAEAKNTFCTLVASLMKSSHQTSSYCSFPLTSFPVLTFATWFNYILLLISLSRTTKDGISDLKPSNLSELSFCPLFI